MSSCVILASGTGAAPVTIRSVPMQPGVRITKSEGKDNKKPPRSGVYGSVVQGSRVRLRGHPKGLENDEHKPVPTVNLEP